MRGSVRRRRRPVEHDADAAPRRETISIAAGTLDGPTELRVVSHWYVSQAGDYYELPDDGAPRHARSGERGLP